VYLRSINFINLHFTVDNFSFASFNHFIKLIKPHRSIVVRLPLALHILILRFNFIRSQVNSKVYYIILIILSRAVQAP